MILLSISKEESMFNEKISDFYHIWHDEKKQTEKTLEHFVHKLLTTQNDNEE